MSKYLAAALKHYAENERKSVLVPEWKDDDGQPLRVFWQLLTYQERTEMNGAGSLDDVSVVIRKAQDAEGKPMFDAADAIKMQKAVSVSVLNRLARLMLDIDAVTEAAVENARKN